MKIKLQNDLISKIDRSFCHDLINHTHGLLLFLSHKKKSKVIQEQDITTLENEIRNLQEIVRQHFIFHHKDVHDNVENISMDDFFSEFKYIIETFLNHSAKSVTTDFEIMGDSSNYFFSQRALLLRVITNIVKNISEANPVDVFISVRVLEGKVVVITENDIPNRCAQVSGRLKIGLSSIEMLVSAMGGKYSFKSNSCWVNEIEIPFYDISLNHAKAS